MHTRIHRPRLNLDTHSVTNQVPFLAGYNAYSSDHALMAALRREGGDWGDQRCRTYGDIAGRDLLELGFPANENPPILHAFDRHGARIDEIEFHPSYHQIMQLAKKHGLHSLSWTANKPGAQVVRGALFYMHNQFEAGTACPITMTHAATPVLARHPEPGHVWLNGLLAEAYDSRSLPAADKTGLTAGMGMTEKQGGTDVRANTTRATVTSDTRIFSLHGHKWFCSAPMSDLFLVLAQDDIGLSCFVLPRWKRNGERNAFEIQRLKNKLGDRSNASAEVEFRQAEACRIGDPGHGIATILEMVAQTRLDCMLGSAALMRQASVQAIHHARHRRVFGQLLIETPLMQQVLADLCLESEAAIAYALRLARAFEGGSEHETRLARLATPIGKFLICKTAPIMTCEAMECLGGNGYVEETILARLYRQAPVNSIWEGSGNVQCLDLLRVLERQPECRDALEIELNAAAGLHSVFDSHCEQLRSLLSGATDVASARRLAIATARALQASILLRAEDSWVGEAFCDSRLATGHLPIYGTAGLNSETAEALIRRANIA